MPFSRSSSIESMTRSFTSWFSRNTPDCQSMASTSVVLPWSTWATIATLRRSRRAGMWCRLKEPGYGTGPDVHGQPSMVGAVEGETLGPGRAPVAGYEDVVDPQEEGPPHGRHVG